MLSDNVGVGPLRFRYWSGTYRRGDARLFVNNGVGNWFPLRVNAPAEIVKLTLRRG
jgi:predicted MPP superfamily phosphohydrolase